jgi:hemerythrin superfamily protein
MAIKSGKPIDAIQILTSDHEAVKKLFNTYTKLAESNGSAEEKAAIAADICMELTVHAQIEEEVFYPAVREAVDDDLMMNEAAVEHGSAKTLIETIIASDPSDEMFDANVIVLSEYINHHVKEEQGDMFPKAKKAKLDMRALGEEIAARKEQLMADYTTGAEDESADPVGKKPATKQRRTLKRAA